LATDAQWRKHNTAPEDAASRVLFQALGRGFSTFKSTFALGDEPAYQIPEVKF
jgi:hypothetical protein